MNAKKKKRLSNLIRRHNVENIHNCTANVFYLLFFVVFVFVSIKFKNNRCFFMYFNVILPHVLIFYSPILTHIV